jgi:hypothetical protein
VSHAHKGFSRNRNTLAEVEADSTRVMTASVSDNIVSFTPVPTPSSHSSLSDTHRFMGFLLDRNVLVADSARLRTGGVSDSIRV